VTEKICIHLRRMSEMTFKKGIQWLAIILLAVLVTACGDKSTATPDSDNEDNETSETLEGTVSIDGSGTVYPLMAKLAEEYKVNEQSGVSVEVSRAGTGAGFEKFLVDDGTHFHNASRQLKEEEALKADESGIDITELKVALDGLTFVVHSDNDWAENLTEEQLIQIFKEDSPITKWSDIDPSFPDEEIQTYGPNENHGTYEFFWENILEEADLKESTNLQQEYSTLVNLISEDKNGIAFFGFGYYVNNTDQLKAVNVDFGDGPVEPSLDTIAEDGD